MNQHSLFDTNDLPPDRFLPSMNQNTTTDHFILQNTPLPTPSARAKKLKSAPTLTQQPALLELLDNATGDTEQSVLENKAQETSLKKTRQQLLKWIGNKQRFAQEIVSYFPESYETYIEQFLGSGAVWSTLAPRKALVSDIFIPLIEIWQTLQTNPEKLKYWYTERWNKVTAGEKVEEKDKYSSRFS